MDGPLVVGYKSTLTDERHVNGWILKWSWDHHISFPKSSWVFRKKLWYPKNGFFAEKTQNLFFGFFNLFVPVRQPNIREIPYIRLANGNEKVKALFCKSQRSKPPPRLVFDSPLMKAIVHNPFLGYWIYTAPSNASVDPLVKVSVICLRVV